MSFAHIDKVTYLYLDILEFIVMSGSLLKGGNNDIQIYNK